VTEAVKAGHAAMSQERERLSDAKNA
jgi:hypothetical protein